MSQHHKWSVTEIEDLIPYERDIYVEMLIAFLRDADNKNTSSDGISMEDIWKMHPDLKGGPVKSA